MNMLNEQSLVAFKKFNRLPQLLLPQSQSQSKPQSTAIATGIAGK